MSTKKNIAANFVGKFWSIISNFLFVPLYIHILGFNSYAIISFTLIISSLMAVLDVGLTATLARELARKDTSKDEKLTVYRTLESLYWFLAAFVTLMIVLASHPIAGKWLNVEAFTIQEVTLFLRIISIDVSCLLLLRFYMGGLYGLEHQVQANGFQILWGVLRNALVLVFILISPKLTTFFVWQACATVVSTILVKTALDKRLTGHVCIGQRPDIKLNVLSKTLPFAMGIFFLNLVSTFNAQFDKLTISKMLSIDVLGHYTLAVSIGQGLTVLAAPFVAALLPRLTALYTQQAHKEAEAVYHSYGMVITVIVASAMSVIVFFPEQLLWVWTGKSDLANKAAVFLPFVAISMAMLALSLHPLNIAIANGYTRLNNILGGISLVVTIPGYWLAVRHYGALGAAVVFCIVQSVNLLVYVYLIRCRFRPQVSMMKVFGEELFLPILCSLTIAFCCSFVPDTVESNRLWMLAWILGVSLLTVTFTSLLFLPVKKIGHLLLTNVRKH